MSDPMYPSSRERREERAPSRRMTRRRLPRPVGAGKGFTVDILTFFRFILMCADLDRLKTAVIAEAMILAALDRTFDR